MVRGLPILISRRTQRTIILISSLPSLLDELLDRRKVSLDEHIALLKEICCDRLKPNEPMLQLLHGLSRALESDRSGIVRRLTDPYFEEERQAVGAENDPADMGYRKSGILGIVRGMMAAIGPDIGWKEDVVWCAESQWSARQRWMFNTALLNQMIDDWMDAKADQESGRQTAVLEGKWTLETIGDLFHRTEQDLDRLLAEEGIRGRQVQQVFQDLYCDYLWTGLRAMDLGAAA